MKKLIVVMIFSSLLGIYFFPSCAKARTASSEMELRFEQGEERPVEVEQQANGVLPQTGEKGQQSLSLVGSAIIGMFLIYKAKKMRRT